MERPGSISFPLFADVNKGIFPHAVSQYHVMLSVD